MKRENLILLADAYKYAHHKFYYPGTTQIYSYLESRGGMFDETIFFGLQYFLKEYLQGPAFTQQDLDEAGIFCSKYLAALMCLIRLNFSISWMNTMANCP
jgi:nicotinamide phosphoribosyltransferase